MLRIILPPGGIVLEQVLVGGGKRWNSVASLTSTAAGLDGMA